MMNSNMNMDSGTSGSIGEKTEQSENMSCPSFSIPEKDGEGMHGQVRSVVTPQSDDHSSSHNVNGHKAPSSVLDQIVLKRMQKRLCSPGTAETLPLDKCDDGTDNHFEKQVAASSKHIPSCTFKFERVNKRKRRKLCNSGSDHGSMIDHSSSLMENDPLIPENKSIEPHNPAIPSESNTNRQANHDAGKAPSLGMRFQALNARAGVMKKGNSLFGMLSKLTERKRHVCDDCGRSFNQLRVLNVHRQMHAIKRNSLPGDRVDRGRALICREEASETIRKPVQNLKGEPADKTVVQSDTCTQDVHEQLVEGVIVANHGKRKRRKHKEREHAEELMREGKGYECNICKKVFGLPSFLRRHQIVHTGEKPFECKFCGKCFGQRATRQRHEATHGRNKPYMCQECGDGFSSPGRLERHVKDRHAPLLPDTESSASQSKPGRARKPKTGTDREMETEMEDSSAVEQGNGTESTPSEGMKVHSCPLCEKVFHQRSHLYRHSLSHTGEKPFSCKDCGKRFSQKATCLRHERSHTGELPFICPECGNGYAQKSGLRIHRLIHTGERPHKCSFCNATFTQKSTCQRHERVHTGEKPFVCQQCGKAFGQNTSLERHVRTHSKGTAPIEVESEKEQTDQS